MKENCVIFDTNILTENKSTLNDIKYKIETTSDILIPKIVIEEIKAQKSRNINDDYLKIKSIIDKNSYIFKYEEKFKIEDALNISEDNIQKWFEKYCNNNVIEYDLITLNDVIERSKYKKPPFINEVGSSDKGFKNSIIWLSILKNEKIKSYKKVIFITNDKNGFIKRVNELIEEYKTEHENELIICTNIDELYNSLNISKIENKDIIEEEKEVMKINNVSELKENINACVSNILYTIYEDDWGNEHCDFNFNIYEKMKDEDVENFLVLLGEFLKENIFFNMLDITDLLIRCGIDSEGENVSAKDLNQLNDIYKNLKNNEELFKPFINFLKVEFNKLYKYKPKIEEDPFKDFGQEIANNDDLPF